MQKKTGPAAATLEDKDALAAAEKGAEVLVLGYFKHFKVRIMCLVCVLGWEDAVVCLCAQVRTLWSVSKCCLSGTTNCRVQCSAVVHVIGSCRR